MFSSISWRRWIAIRACVKGSIVRRRIVIFCAIIGCSGIAIIIIRWAVAICDSIVIWRIVIGCVKLKIFAWTFLSHIISTIFIEVISRAANIIIAVITITIAFHISTCVGWFASFFITITIINFIDLICSILDIDLVFRWIILNFILIIFMGILYRCMLSMVGFINFYFCDNLFCLYYLIIFICFYTCLNGIVITDFFSLICNEFIIHLDRFCDM